MSIKSFIPFTAERARKGHVKYLDRLVSGHDVLLSIEWADGELTYLPADLRPDMDGWYEATNGLLFAPIGQGTEPVSHEGVPMIRVHAMIACPISTTAALQTELDEDGEYEVREGEDGRTQKVVYYEPVEDPDEVAEDAADQTNGNEPLSGPEVSPDADSEDDPLAADGGVRTEPTKEYDLRPPAPAVGWQFGLDEAKQRAPHPISPNMLQRAKQYGREMAFGASNKARYMLLGMGIMLAILVVLVILAIVFMNLTGGGGGGGGGSSADENLSLLLLAAGPAGHAIRRRLTQAIKREE